MSFSNHPLKFLMGLLAATAFISPAMAATGDQNIRVPGINTNSSKAGVSKRDIHTNKKNKKDVLARSEEINVSARQALAGGGLMAVQTASKTRSEVTQEYIAKQSPITAPETLIASLPGVQTSNEGPISTTSQTMHIRGLDQTQIGFLFEGIPVSDPFTYAPTLSGQLDNENIGAISVTQGSSDVNAPLYNADGAQVSMTMRRPSDKFQVFGDTTGGTHATEKQFLRVDTGEIGRSGFRAYWSGSYSSGNLWRGPGSAYRWHSDVNIDKTWGRGNDVDLIFNYNHSNQTEWLYPTLAQFKEYGTGYNTNSRYYAGDTSYYKLNTKAVNDLSGILHSHFELGEGFSLDASAYSFHNAGPNNYGVTIPLQNGYVGTQEYTHLDGRAASGGTLTAISIHPFVQTNSGMTLDGKWRRGHNTVQLSYYYSYTVHTEYQHHYAIDGAGGYTENDGPITVLGGTPITQYNVNGFQQVNSLALDDKLSLFGDRLTIDAGIKATMISRSFSEDLPGTGSAKSVENMFDPTPQILLSYQFSRANQIFVNGTTGFRAPSSFQAQVPTYSFTSSKPSSEPLSVFRPEYMIGEEIGFRHNGGFMFTLSAFNYNLTHHQISSQSYLPNSTILISQPIDAGGETARGLQAEVGTKPWHHISAYGSGQYMHTSIDNNIAYGGDYLPTKGKQAVASPKFVAALGLTYDDGTNFGNFNFRYQDSQYSTLMNDESMPAYFTADASLGHRFPTLMHHVKPKIALELLNLGDVHYLSTVNGFSVAAKSTRGVYGNTIAGSNPTYGVGTGFTALVTLSAEFE